MSFVFCLRFLLTSYVLISTKYLIILFIYSTFPWSIIFCRLCLPNTVHLVALLHTNVAYTHKGSGMTFTSMPNNQRFIYIYILYVFFYVCCFLIDTLLKLIYCGIITDVPPFYGRILEHLHIMYGSHTFILWTHWPIITYIQEKWCGPI